MKIPKLFDEDLVRAAEILEREAHSIHSSFTVNNRWERGSVLPRMHHDEMRKLARRFRKVAGVL